MRARAALLAVAALSVCASHGAHPPPAAHPRLMHIKGQILAKLGLSSPPQPVGAPPRDVVRQILARAARADPPPPHPEPHADEMREVIAIAHRGRDVQTYFSFLGIMKTQEVSIYSTQAKPPP